MFFLHFKEVRGRVIIVALWRQPHKK